jgi:hypothetical protein
LAVCQTLAVTGLGQWLLVERGSEIPTSLKDARDQRRDDGKGSNFTDNIDKRLRGLTIIPEISLLVIIRRGSPDHRHLRYVFLMAFAGNKLVGFQSLSVSARLARSLPKVIELLTKLTN